MAGICSTDFFRITGQRDVFDFTTSALHIPAISFGSGEYYAKLKLIPNSSPLRFKVDQLVNIATPHKGTIWAALAPITQATRDMTPGSSLIKSIEGYYPGLNLWSWCDEIVIPNSSANVGNSSSIGCWGHVLSTHSWGVFKKARDFVAP